MGFHFHNTATISLPCAVLLSTHLLKSTLCAAQDGKLAADLVTATTKVLVQGQTLIQAAHGPDYLDVVNAMLSYGVDIDYVDAVGSGMGGWLDVCYRG